MDQKPQNARGRSTRRMDGVGSSAANRQAGAPLDLRNVNPSKPSKSSSSTRPVGSKATPPAPASTTPPAPSYQPSAPIKLQPPTSERSTSLNPPNSQGYDDPLHGLLGDNDDHEAPSTEYIAPTPSPKLIKKSQFWRSFWRFMAILLVILFVVSAGLFIYLSYFSGQ